MGYETIIVYMLQSRKKICVTVTIVFIIANVFVLNVEINDCKRFFFH